MSQIKLKRVYEDYDDQDGYRVLIDRLWPRGVKKEHLHYDLWAKEITPSPALRTFFHEDPIERWVTFREKYEDELKNSPEVKTFIQDIREYPVITLLYASKDIEHNHAVILKSFLDRELNKTE